MHTQRAHSIIQSGKKTDEMMDLCSFAEHFSCVLKGFLHYVKGNNGKCQNEVGTCNCLFVGWPNEKNLYQFEVFRFLSLQMLQ